MIKYYKTLKNARLAARSCKGRVYYNHKVKGYYVKKPKNCFFLKI